MKLENWNEYDKAPAKTRYVKNKIELSERRILLILDSTVKRAKKEMATLTAISIAIQTVGYFILLRHGSFRERFRKLVSVFHTPC